MAMRCQKCNTPRAVDPCFKCGSPLEEGHPDWAEPELPSVEPLRALAKEVGYALAVHGSLERDLDVIAAPWTEVAVSAQELLEHLADGLGANLLGIEKKPLGRLAATLQLKGWYRPIDISVCPRLVEE